MTNTKLANKQTGAFYTPFSLATLLATEVLHAWTNTHPNTVWKDLTILDPAAGEGGLLIPLAHKLVKLRKHQEPNLTDQELLQDVFSRQLFAADISAVSLSKIPLPKNHIYHGDSLAAQGTKSVLHKWLPNAVDIVLANPPYIGQKGHAALFNKLRQNTLWQKYVCPKSDLMYYFFYLALHVLKPGGLAGFITTPYFSTAAGAKQLRQTLQKNATFLRLIDFEEKQLFKPANLHTLVSVFQKGNYSTLCEVGQKQSISISQNDLFYGKDSFLHTHPTTNENDLLKRMGTAPYTLDKIASVANGLMTGCDKAFVLTETEKDALSLTSKELTKLKPFFKNSDILPYAAHTQARLWLIDFFYPNDRDMEIKNYPNLLAHLSKFRTQLLARKQNNNGIDKQLAQGRFWFGSVRRKFNFENEKIVLPHRASNLVAAYTKEPWYASSDVYFIANPKPPYTLWTILGLLNSSPYSIWVKANGKRKGNLVELYSAPLKQLPIPGLTPAKQQQIEQLTRSIYQQVQAGNTAAVSNLQNQLDKLVTSCF